MILPKLKLMKAHVKLRTSGPQCQRLTDLYLTWLPEKDIIEVSTDKALTLKMKELKKASEETESDLQHLGGQGLSDEDISKLKEFSLARGYKPRSVLFGGVDEEILGVFLTVPKQRLLIFYQRLLDFRSLSETSVTIGDNTLLGAYSTRILRCKLLCLPI
jgi:hypothetical protein